jgi:3-oxoacyl-[acyl-carrier-protein] synthase I
MGACTPVGRDAWSSAAAVRAGICGFGEHPSMRDTADEPMRVAIAPWLDIDCRGADRLAMLLFPALDQALAPLAAALDPSRTAITLALPSPRAGLDEDIQSQLTARLPQQGYGQFFGTGNTFASGHAAGLIALHAARAKLGQGALDACVVAGVDSYIEPVTLERLEADGQLHSAGPLNNAWGFVPGEAAGVLLLMRASTAQAAGLTPLATVLGSGQSLESKRIKTETVCIGQGLTQALAAALAALPAGAQVSDVYCDLNGEPYRADEYGFAALRTQERFEAGAGVVAPADCWGDVGAAGGVLHAMLACVAGHKGYARGSLALAWASSEGGERAAVLMQVDKKESPWQ